MDKKYKFEELLESDMPLESNEKTISALQVGLGSLIAALEKTNPGFSETFLECFDNNYELNKESTSRMAIAQLGIMMKYSLKQL